MGSKAAEAIGKQIRAWRLSRLMSQEALAKACGWESQSRISAYESGRNEPGFDDLRLIAKALNTGLIELITTTPPWPKHGASSGAQPESSESLPKIEELLGEPYERRPELLGEPEPDYMDPFRQRYEAAPPKVKQAIDLLLRAAERLPEEAERIAKAVVALVAAK